MEKVVLKGITWDHSRGFDPLVACSEQYRAETGIEIHWQKRTLKDFGDQSLQDLANQYDLLIVDHPHSGVSADSQCVIALDQHILPEQLAILENQSAGPSFKSYFYAQHQWALPIDAAMQCAAYRADLLDSPVPKNWQQVLEVEGLGMALCPTDSLCSFLSLSAQMGAPIREQNSYLVDEEKGVKVLTLMRELYSAAHPDSANMNPIQLFDLMADSNEISYSPMSFCYTNYSRENYRTNLLTFADSPLWQSAETETQYSTVLGGAGIAISANCQYKKQACDFALWICGKDTQVGIYTQAEGQPGNMLAWQNESTNSLTNHFFNHTMQTLKSAYVRPRFAKWPGFQEHLGDIVHEYLVLAKNPLNVIRYLNQEYAKLKAS